MVHLDEEKKSTHLYKLPGIIDVSASAASWAACRGDALTARKHGGAGPGIGSSKKLATLIMRGDVSEPPVERAWRRVS